jgi:hypothetical protein
MFLICGVYHDAVVLNISKDIAKKRKTRNERVEYFKQTLALVPGLSSPEDHTFQQRLSLLLFLHSKHIAQCANLQYALKNQDDIFHFLLCIAFMSLVH